MSDKIGKQKYTMLSYLEFEIKKYKWFLVWNFESKHSKIYWYQEKNLE